MIRISSLCRKQRLEQELLDRNLQTAKRCGQEHQEHPNVYLMALPSLPWQPELPGGLFYGSDRSAQIPLVSVTASALPSGCSRSVSCCRDDRPMDLSLADVMRSSACTCRQAGSDRRRDCLHGRCPAITAVMVGSLGVAYHHARVFKNPGEPHHRHQFGPPWAVTASTWAGSPNYLHHSAVRDPFAFVALMIVLLVATTGTHLAVHTAAGGIASAPCQCHDVRRIVMSTDQRMPQCVGC